MSSSTNTSTTATSPITSRQPHSGSTPPTSPIDSVHLALLRSNDDDDGPSSSSSHRTFPLTEPPTFTLDPATPPIGTGGTGSGSGWTFNWGSAKKGKGHERPLSREEINDAAGDLRRKKRSLSDRLGEASGELAGVLKRRMSGVSGVRRSGDGDDAILKSREGRVGEMKRLIGSRMRYAVKRGNLPFVIVFMVCLVMFLSALAGIGYVPPPDKEALAMNSAAAFKIGQPVHEGADSVTGQQIMAARRKMEEAWDKKKRPKDGAWMKKQRNDGAVRRKAKSNDKSKPKAAEKEERPAPIDPKIREEAVKEGAP